MKQVLITLLCSISLIPFGYGQTLQNYQDEFLTKSFKVFQAADFELAYHILPFLRKRFESELKDTLSFTNPFDSLSNCMKIMHSADGQVKTYCWSERSGGCCHTSATYAQFKTASGKIAYVDLEEMVEGDEEVFIFDVQVVNMGETPHYLMLGWGTCCGGKHYSTARVYEVVDEQLIQSDSIFDQERTLYIGANRPQKIDLEYAPKSKILSYNQYEYDEDIGFYKREKTVVQWKWTNQGFRRVE